MEFFIAFVFGGLPDFRCAAADGPPEQVDGVVRSYIHEDGPGTAVLVFKDGVVVHKKGYGLADMAGRLAFAELSRSVKEYHRGLEYHRFAIGVRWFEAKRGIVRRPSGPSCRRPR